MELSLIELFYKRAFTEHFPGLASDLTFPDRMLRTSHGPRRTTKEMGLLPATVKKTPAPTEDIMILGIDGFAGTFLQWQ